MPKRNRKSLKAAFKNGSRPSELDFENLIDSSLNILDDGISKSPDHGLILSPAPERQQVISIFSDPLEEDPLWELSLDPQTGELSVGRHKERGVSTAPAPLVTLNPNGDLIIGAQAANITLKGTVAISSRQGSFTRGEVPADGRWHDITPPLEGCWALEVVAGCGRKNTGKHALIVATAVHCFGARPRICCTGSYYGVHGHKIRLRWKKRGYACTLQSRTAFDYGSNIRIRYHITSLWNDPCMETINSKS